MFYFLFTPGTVFGKINCNQELVYTAKKGGNLKSLGKPLKVCFSFEKKQNYMKIMLNIIIKNNHHFLFKKVFFQKKKKSPD